MIKRHRPPHAWIPAVAGLLTGFAAASASWAQSTGTPDPANKDFRDAAVSHGAASTDPAYAGIWKGATPPPGTIQGEFDANDPVGLAAGVIVHADCSINWVNPDSGKRYCFASPTSLVSFLTAPHTYLMRASAAWSNLKPEAHPGGAQ